MKTGLEFRMVRGSSDATPCSDLHGEVVPSEILPGTPQALGMREDLFCSLMSKDAKVAQEEVDGQNLINALMTSELPDLPHLREMRESLNGDRAAAAAMSVVVETIIRRNPGDFMSPENKRDIVGYSEAINRLQMSRMERDMVRIEKKKLYKKDKTADLRVYNNRITKLQNEIELYESVADRTKHAIFSEFDSEGFFQKVDELFEALLNGVSALDSLGGYSPFGLAPEMTDPNKKLSLVRKLMDNPVLKKFLDKFGRNKNIVSRMLRERVKHGYDEIVDVTKSDAIQRALPSELFLSMNKTCRPLFYEKLAEKKLLCYQMESTENKGRGPIILCVDQSGSMKGDPDIWAKGLTGGFLKICEAQRRDLHVVLFSGKGQVNNYSFPKNKPISPETLFTLMSDFMNGGTCYQTALSTALHEFIIPAGGQNKSDIIFISDGEASLSDDYISRFNKDKVNFKIFVQSILLCSGDPDIRVLDKFSDKVMKLDVNTADEEEVVRNLMTNML